MLLTHFLCYRTSSRVAVSSEWWTVTRSSSMLSKQASFRVAWGQLSYIFSIYMIFSHRPPNLFTALLPLTLHQSSEPIAVAGAVYGLKALKAYQKLFWSVQSALSHQKIISPSMILKYHQNCVKLSDMGWSSYVNTRPLSIPSKKVQFPRMISQSKFVYPSPLSHIQMVDLCLFYRYFNAECFHAVAMVVYRQQNSLIYKIVLF